jgi:hypothetical protein
MPQYDGSVAIYRTAVSGRTVLLMRFDGRVRLREMAPIRRRVQMEKHFWLKSAVVYFLSKDNMVGDITSHSLDVWDLVLEEVQS